MFLLFPRPALPLEESLQSFVARNKARFPHGHIMMSCDQNLHRLNTIAAKWLFSGVQGKSYMKWKNRTLCWSTWIFSGIQEKAMHEMNQIDQAISRAEHWNNEEDWSRLDPSRYLLHGRLRRPPAIVHAFSNPQDWVQPTGGKEKTLFSLTHKVEEPDRRDNNSRQADVAASQLSLRSHGAQRMTGWIDEASSQRAGQSMWQTDQSPTSCTGRTGHMLMSVPKRVTGMVPGTLSHVFRPSKSRQARITQCVKDGEDDAFRPRRFSTFVSPPHLCKKFLARRKNATTAQ